MAKRGVLTICVVALLGAGGCGDRQVRRPDSPPQPAEAPVREATGPLPKYAPPVEAEPKAEPQAWLIHDTDKGRWCAFKTNREFKTFSETLDRGTRDWAWVRHDGRALSSVTEVHQSEDAIAEDRYLFSGLTITALKRSGRYINAPWATFNFLPDASGKMVLTEAGRTVAAKLTEQGEETYIIDWATHRKLSDFPFSSLLTVTSNKVSVRFGCTATTGPVPED